MMKVLGGIIIAVAILACTHVDDRPPSIDTTSTGSGHEQSIDFVDLNSFDETLSARLRENRSEVTVTFEALTTINDIPERLRKWLTMVEKYDGNVEFQEDSDYQTRGIPGIFSIAAGAFFLVYKAISNKILYSPAKDYNATVRYIGGSGRITKVVFLHKVHTS